jgi:deferrochelatase/peroxidase EfeB
MAVTLNAPISWKSAAGDDRKMLDDLQPNILKPHTRDFLSILFLRFADQGGGRAFLRDLVTLMKSATLHLQEVEAFKAGARTPGTPYVGLGLTAAGYGALGVDAVPADPSFLGGMQATAALNDPDLATWDAHFRETADLHAIVLIGDMGMRTQAAMHDRVVEKINAAKGVVVLGTQDGIGQHNSNGAGIEHFGYVDGRSQPLFFLEDIDEEENTTDGTANWSPSFPLGQAIVADPAAPDPRVHFGSYFIFRKLEQNVKLFKTS